MIDASPSEILQKYFIEEGLVSYPHSLGDWPCFTESLPDGDRAVDNALCIYDDTPEKDGRLMKTGEVIDHYVVIILCRAQVYLDGWRKIATMMQKLDELVDQAVEMGSGESYSLLNATCRRGLTALGLDKGTRRRFLFDTQYAITIRPI